MANPANVLQGCGVPFTAVSLPQQTQTINGNILPSCGPPFTAAALPQQTKVATAYVFNFTSSTSSTTTSQKSGQFYP